MRLPQNLNRRWLCIAGLVPLLLNVISDTIFHSNHKAGFICVISGLIFTVLTIFLAARIDWQDPLPNRVWKDFRLQ